MIFFVIERDGQLSAAATRHGRHEPVFLEDRPSLRRLQIEALKAEVRSRTALLLEGHAFPENAAGDGLLDAAVLGLQ